MSPRFSFKSMSLEAFWKLFIVKMNNNDHFTTVQCSREKSWMPAFMWILTHPNIVSKSPQQKDVHCFTTILHMSSDKELNGLSSPQNSPDPNSIGHARESPVHGDPRSQPTGLKGSNILVVDTTGTTPEVMYLCFNK